MRSSPEVNKSLACKNLSKGVRKLVVRLTKKEAAQATTAQ
jgi:hypothetical protein